MRYSIDLWDESNTGVMIREFEEFFVDTLPTATECEKFLEGPKAIKLLNRPEKKPTGVAFSVVIKDLPPKQFVEGHGKSSFTVLFPQKDEEFCAEYNALNKEYIISHGGTIILKEIDGTTVLNEDYSSIPQTMSIALDRSLVVEAMAAAQKVGESMSQYVQKSLLARMGRTEWAAKEQSE